MVTQPVLVEAMAVVAAHTVPADIIPATRPMVAVKPAGRAGVRGVGAGACAVLTTWEEKPDTIAENRAVPNVMSSRIQIAVSARTQITTPTKLARGDSACPMSGMTRAGAERAEMESQQNRDLAVNGSRKNVKKTKPETVRKKHIAKITT